MGTKKVSVTLTNAQTRAKYSTQARLEADNELYLTQRQALSCWRKLCGVPCADNGYDVAGCYPKQVEQVNSTLYRICNEDNADKVAKIRKAQHEGFTAACYEVYFNCSEGFKACQQKACNKVVLRYKGMYLRAYKEGFLSGWNTAYKCYSAYYSLAQAIEANPYHYSYSARNVCNS